MPLSFRLVLALALALALVPGCIENMGDLKEALGVVEPVQTAALHAPPSAKIEAASGIAVVGEPFQLSGAGSRDPQGFALLYAWDFGDGGVGAGATIAHVFEAPGDRIVRLTVTSVAGLSDEDTLAVRVAARDRAPTVGLRAPSSGIVGEPLEFEAFASDPEGGALAYEWDFGDGSTLRCDLDGCRPNGASVARATSRDARPSHAYARPGAYEASVRVSDAADQRAEASARVAIDGVWRAEGVFKPGVSEPAQLTFPVVAGARSVDVVLSFGAGLAGLNDVEIVVLDAGGAEVGRSDGALGDAPARALTIALAEAAPGEWTVRVEKESILDAEWTLEIRERLS